VVVGRSPSRSAGKTVSRFGEHRSGPHCIGRSRNCCCRKKAKHRYEQELGPEEHPDTSLLSKGDILIELPDGTCWYVGEKAKHENDMSYVNFDTKGRETLLLTIAAEYVMGYQKDFELVFGLPWEPDKKKKQSSSRVLIR
jgi:hypothetical protein